MAATREWLLREATTALGDARGKLAAADSRADNLLREREAHQQAVTAWDLTRAKRGDELALCEKELGSREEKIKARED